MVNIAVKCRSDRLSSLPILLLILASFFTLAGLEVTGCTAIMPKDSDYTEEAFAVHQGDSYQLEVFLEEDETLECYWTSSEYLQWWYRDSYGSPRVMNEEDWEAAGARGLHIRRLLEPGMPSPGIAPYDLPLVEIADAQGNIVSYEPLGGSRTGQDYMKVNRTGYYTLCFYIFDDEVELANVTVRYRVY